MFTPRLYARFRRETGLRYLPKCIKKTTLRRRRHTMRTITVDGRRVFGSLGNSLLRPLTGSRRVFEAYVQS